jgi:hypothetical protein
VYPLKNSAILDSGTTLHIFNQISRFHNFRTANPDDYVFAGNTRIRIKGYGEVDMCVKGPSGTRILRLYDVALCDGFACNIVSLRLIRRRGFWWDNKLPNNFVRSHDNTIICELVEKHDQYVMEYIPYKVSRASFYARRHKYNSWTKRAPNLADSHTWHLRLGHPGPEALNHLVTHSQGVRIKGIPTVECDDCACAKAKRSVRREPREEPDKAGSHLAIDFHDFEPDTVNDGFKSVMLITDRFSGYIWDFYLQNRDAKTIVSALWWFFNILAKQHQILPEVIECDNEITKSSHIKNFLSVRCGMKLEPSAPNTQSQNGGAERSGGVIKEKARAMRLGSKLPGFLWHEIVRSAVYLHNRTPRYIYNWKTPYERFFTYLAYRDGVVATARKPQQAHLRVFGCKAFAMTSDAQLKKNRLQRFNPRAWIGYLVGYNSTNIYRIWNPRTNKVIAIRDVTFNEKDTFNGDLQTMKDDLLHISSEELEALLQNTDLTEQSETNGRTMANINEDEDLSYFEDIGHGEGLEEEAESSDPQVDSEEPIERTDPGTQVDSEEPIERTDPTSLGSVDKEAGLYETDHLRTDEWTVPYLTPDLTPSPPAALLAAAIRDSALSAEKEAQIPFHDKVGEQATHVRDVHRERELRPVNPEFNYWRTAFNAGRLVAKFRTTDGETVSKAHLAQKARVVACGPSSENLSGGSPPSRGKVIPAHRRSLPSPPKTHKALIGHPFEKQFREAEKAHLKSHEELRTWRVVPKEIANQKQILDCMWVYVYKYDKHGRLQKCKARLVVRGDQQAKAAHQNTYASTLAARSFRSLMAIAARFDLELIQYDVVNAFVNADLNQEVYMRMPPGYRMAGMILQLQKALYGLREAPLLWQQHFTDTLKRIGFRTIPHEPCCMTSGGILIFFYVDDIVFAFRRDKTAQATDVAMYLKQTYNLTGGGNLQWFLGIEVVRDRNEKLIWLSQASYIDKITRLVTDTSAGRSTPNTPMRNKELLPYEGHASHSSINQYQKKIGSILYAAVITRVDIAFPASRLARFNSNPGDEHHKEADRVLRYLAGTRNLALQLGEGDDFEVASDASFADNTLDRTSSQAYVMKLFGGTIGWRANKQDTVTTSTTEAELLSLAQAAKEAMFISRLIREFGVTLDESRITIQCDNKQTIRLVNADIALLQTKLRHVDIHNHWLRQEAARKRIQVVYTPTDDMMADGLTKVLPYEAHQRFVRQIGLIDIKERLGERRLQEITLDELEQIEDSISGGEAAVTADHENVGDPEKA